MKRRLSSRSTPSASSALRAAAIVATFAAVLCGGRPARADSPPTRAQALFYEARTLMSEGRYALACPKLEESLRLEHGLGTEFNLADCNERLGKIASAWAGFVSVAEAARAQGQSQREKIARDRAKALEARVPTLTIEITEPAPPGLELRRDGIVISGAGPKTTPIDPGEHRLAASAPGRQPWEGRFDAPEGEQVTIVVPSLAPVEAAEASVPRNAPAASTRASDRAVAAPVVPETFPAPVVERGRTQRTAGWIVAGVGLAGLGVATAFAIDSIQKAERADRYCDDDLCDAEGVALRERAIRSGDVATVATIAGAACILGGVTLLLTAPRRSAPSAAGPQLRAVPHVAANGGGLLVQGLLP